MLMMMMMIREGNLVGAGGGGAVPVLVGSEVHQAGVVLHIEIFGGYSNITKYYDIQIP